LGTTGEYNARAEKSVEKHQPFRAHNMNVWVLYESQWGNTAQLAIAMAQEMARSDHVRLFLANQAGAPTELELLLVGIPSHRHSRPYCVLDWVRRLPAGSLAGVRFSVFDIRYVQFRWFEFSMAHKIGRALLRKGGKYAGPPESFFLTGHKGPLAEGEIQRACAWAVKLIQRPS
jgi:flavodoxin